MSDTGKNYTTNQNSMSDKPSSKPIVLVVDDEIGPRESFSVLLRKDYKVLKAHSVLEGLHYIAIEPVSLVFMDIRMPNYTGIDGISMMLNIDPALAIVIITGYISLDSIKKAVSKGAKDFLTKPFDLEEILRVAKRFAGTISRVTDLPTTKEKLVKVNQIFVDELASLEENNNLLRKQLKDLQDGKSSLNNKIKKLLQKQPNKKIRQDIAYPLDAESKKTIIRERSVYASLAHSIKGELQNVGSGLYVITQELADAGSHKDTIESVERSLGFSDLLSSRIMDFSQNLGYRKDRVLISKVVEEVQMLIEPRIPTTAEIRIDFKDSITGIEVLADKEQLKAVLIELLQNSCKAILIAGSEISLQIAIKTNKRVSFIVSDDGPGIPENIREKVFHSPIANTSGQGIGLYLAKRNVNNWGGKIVLRKSSRSGTSIEIILPIAGTC